MSDLRLVATRELRERLRSKAFRGSTIFTLVLLIAIIVVVTITSDEGPDAYVVGVVGELPATFDDSLGVAATASEVIVDTIPQPSREAAEASLEAGTIDAAVIDVGSIVLDQSDDRLEAVLGIALRQSRLFERLADAGIGSEEAVELLLPGIQVRVETLDDEGDTVEATGFAVFGVVLLFIVITTYGQWVLLGVLEEKTYGVVELVAAAVPIRTLLAGKVIGIGVLGLAQMLLLVGIGLVSGITFDLFELPDTAAAVAVWSIVWFLLGFAFYAVINAATGSLVSRQEDAQAAAIPITVVLMASYLGTFVAVIPDADGPLAVGLSLIPTVAPIAYPARIALDAVAGWELVVGILLMAGAIYGVITVAARVYTGALLQSGARIKVRQAWRAARDVAGG